MRERTKLQQQPKHKMIAFSVNIYSTNTILSPPHHSVIYDFHPFPKRNATMPSLSEILPTIISNDVIIGSLHIQTLSSFVADDCCSYIPMSLESQ